jgi:hypothetical protein
MNEYLAERDLWWPVSPELMDSYRDGSHTKEWPDGSLVWLKNGVFHRDGDKPAFIGSKGTLEWYKNGLLHRTTGPAIIRPDNSYEYWINGVNITEEVESWLKIRKYKYPFTFEQQVEFTLTFG